MKVRILEAGPDDFETQQSGIQKSALFDPAAAESISRRGIDPFVPGIDLFGGGSMLLAKQSIYRCPDRIARTQIDRKTIPTHCATVQELQDTNAHLVGMASAGA